MGWPGLRRISAWVARQRSPTSAPDYRLMAEQSPDVIIRYDLRGVIEYLSPALDRYGIDASAIVGRNMAELIARDEIPRHEAFMADLAAGRPTPVGAQNVWRTRVPGGRWVSWEGLTNPVRKDGKVVGAMSVLRDVTDRVALEEALAQQRREADEAYARMTESEARYRVLADYCADIIVQYDTQGIVQFISPSVERVLGYGPETIVGRRIGQFGERDPDTPRKVLEDVARGVRPAGLDNEFQLPRADGTLIWLQGNPTFIRDGEGRVQGVVTLLRDITERRALEEELRAQKIQADAAAAAKAEFLANMSHEIRTPLTAVVGFAGLLAKTPELPERARRYVDLIARGGEGLTAIINNVLDFSKIEAGQVELRPEPADPAVVIREALDVVADDAAAKGLSLSVEGVGSLPSAVRLDPGRFRQVLLNLVANAVKFTHQGGVVVSASHDLASGRLRIDVRDTGIGVPADLSDQLFQRFSQLESSNARRFGGTGLGLAISKALVQLMEGEIGVESDGATGSTFWFTLNAPAIRPRRTPEAVGPDPTLGPAHILVVDDSGPNRELLLALLSGHPVTVVEAENGLEALHAARRERFDLILMDLQMPEMDGMAASREIRASAPKNRDTPIIAVSASVSPEDVEACGAAGMNDHIPKPIDPRDLLAKVASWSRQATPLGLHS